ncbi:hypothetical protein MRBLMI12_000422 [Microbacterium sp. LMI12-1-1.1]|uniref:hypothetical protein n=1 Tax=Microbacterium sp. LMI12-1-1.1 TaxID=3135225 RepID=UPI0034458C44
MQATEQVMLEAFGELLVGDPNNKELKETWDHMRRMLGREDHGWVQIQGTSGWASHKQFGLDLQALKDWSAKILPSCYAAPWVKTGFARRADYIWQNGIRYGNVPGSKGNEVTQGKKNVQRLIDDAENQLHFFGDEARRQRELNLYSQGIAFWIGNDKTKKLEAVPLWQITDILLDPNGLGFAWGYLRSWSVYDFATSEWRDEQRWYLTDRHASKRSSIPTITLKAKPRSRKEPTAVPVDQEHVIFDMHANRAQGLVLGAPDALAAWVWNGIAVDATLDGRSMQRALTTFALQAKVPSKDAGESTSIKLASADGAGNTFIGESATDLAPLSSAGKGYDFTSIRFLVAIVAAALDISVIDLTANPGDAGSSYGAGQLMSLPTRLAMEARRRDHVALDKRVLSWMGVVDPDVNFVPFATGEEVYRAVQALTMELTNGAITLEEYRTFLDDLMGRPNGDAPGYDKLHVVQLAKATAKATPQPAAASGDGGSKTAPQTASPSQGKSTGSGKQGSAGNDIRRDGKK